MIDGFVLVSPLLLPILLLLIFVGCTGRLYTDGVRFELRIPAELRAQEPRALFHWTVDGASRLETVRTLVRDPDRSDMWLFEFSQGPVDAAWEVWCEMITGVDGRRWPFVGPVCSAALGSVGLAVFGFEAARNAAGEWEIQATFCPDAD